MSLLDDLERVSSQFGALLNRLPRSNASKKEKNAALQALLPAVSTALTNDPAYPDVDPAALQRADDLLHRMIDAAFGNDFDFDFLPSFAHGDRPVVTDPERAGLGGSLGASSLQSLMPLLQRLGVGGQLDVEGMLNAEHSLRGLEKWVYMKKPDPQSSPIARFKPDIILPNTKGLPLAQAVFHARLSAYSERTCAPIALYLPSGSSCLAFLATGGYKNRDPVLSCYFIDEVEKGGYGISKCTETSPGLVDIAHHVELDPSRKFVYVADRSRIKSYKYDVKTGRNEILAVHTLNSFNEGPLLLMDDGNKLLRGGDEGVELWNVDALPTHGPNGKKPVGDGTLNIEDSWRQDPSEIERSRGVRADTTTPLAEGAIAPRAWSLLPNGKLVVAPRERYSCWLSDVDHGLKTTMRFIGHGAYVNGLSTSPGDAQSFLTTCNDGFARLFDTRDPLPQISLDCGSSDEFLMTALYAHIEGIPVVFSGGEKSQSIKLWDIRNKRTVYELATGNNEVTSLAWDASRNTLFAATECSYVDRLGSRHGYRFAKIPSTPHNSATQGDCHTDPEARDEEDEDIEIDDDDDDDWVDEPDEGHGWPEQAFHDESSFGYAFDSGEHRIFKYKFGLDTDPKVLPEYGDALPAGAGDDEW